MPSTRSGIIYNTRSSSIPVVASSTQESQVRKSPRFEGMIHPTMCPATFEPIITTTQNTRPQRSNRTAFPAELIREYCNDSDNDCTSDYEIEDEEVQQYTQYMSPKYEVYFDFDEASSAWRANKRRVGESWVYKLNPKHPENFRFDIVDDAVKSVTAHIAANTSSVASRVKQNRRHNFKDL
jgi:hypothetical protein